MMKFKTTVLASALGLAVVASPLYGYQDAAKPAEAPKKAEVKKPKKDPIAEMRKEMSKLTTEYSLLMQRIKNENLEREIEKAKWASDASYKSAQLKQKYAAANHKLRDEAEANKLKLAKQNAEIARLRQEASQLSAETALLSAKTANESAKRSQELAKISAQNKLELAKLKKKYELQIAEMSTEDNWRAVKNKNKDVVVKDMEYPINPLKDGTLRISDRRIGLNGPIVGGTAKYITDRIHFFNNQSKTKPIFIVIDSSPGGSVLEGFRIVQAIEASDAPIHVVVKSFAASMAAAITTLADHSYCYPNAIILHHQMSSGMRGNMTQQKEALEQGYEWEKRLSHPIAKKMGISQEEFRKKMYDNNSDGDWAEFGDVAKKLKWVNNVVKEIREDSFAKRPGAAPVSRGFSFEAKEQVDSQGRRFIRLPRIHPVDMWYLHAPDGYYRP